MVKKELHKPTVEKIHMIIHRSVVTETVLYVISSYAGYFSVLTATPTIIINRQRLPGSKDYLMLIGRLGICLKVLTSLTLA
jgi:hypothetical protein